MGWLIQIDQTPNKPAHTICPDVLNTLGFNSEHSVNAQYVFACHQVVLKPRLDFV